MFNRTGRNIVGLCNTGYKIPLSDKITNPNLETVNYYDNYAFLQNYSAELGNLISNFQVKGSCAQGLLTGKIQVASDGGKVIDVFFYDGKGQIVDNRRLYVGKRLTCIHTDYSYTGKPTKIVTDEYSINDGNKSLAVSLIQENGYSKRTDKLLSSALSVNGKKETILQFEYDDFGRIKSITRGGNAGAVKYDYNLHGWTTNIDSKDFHEELHYTDGVGTPCYNGNISSQLWSTSDYGQVRGYRFVYDNLDRLKEAVYGETPSLSDKQNRYNEKVLEYTGNGAMKRFQRRGRKDDGEYGKIDNLNIKLNGNQLLSVTDDALPANKYSSFNFIDGSNEQVEYEYNGVGALTKDLNRGMTVSYDNLNNPRQIDFKGGNSITYNYLSDGTLLSKHYGSQFGSGNKARSFAESKNVYTDSDMSDRTIADTLVQKPDFSGSDMMWDGPADVFVVGETEYSGNIIYSNGYIDKVLFPGGYCTFSKAKSDEPIFHYYTQDHLGNNRIVTNEDGTVEQIVHYYPFGGTFNDAGLNAGLQQYKYNGKELDRIAGLNTYDYGARQYFSALPTWDRMDNMAEFHYETSPYAYCGNNPIKRFDPDGNDYEVKFSYDESTGMGTATVSAIIYAFNEYDFSIAQKNANEINDLSGKFIYKAGTKDNPLNFTVNFNLQVQIANKGEKMDYIYNENSFETTNIFKGVTNGITQNGKNIGIKESRANTSTVKHEFGHMLGMTHSEKGIMTAESFYRDNEEFNKYNIYQTVHGVFSRNVEYDDNMHRLETGEGHLVNNTIYNSDILRRGKVIYNK